MIIRQDDTTERSLLEVHSHNVFSNVRNGSTLVPLDCGVSFTDQLESAHNNGINALFVTNHNTPDG